MNKISLLLKQLNQRPIVFFPIYRDITKSCTGGILLSQLMFWFSKKDKFWKTDQDIMDETRLTLNEFKLAKKRIKKLPFITVSRKGIPAKTWYEIDYVEIQKVLNKIDGNHLTVMGDSTNLYKESKITSNINNYPNSDECGKARSSKTPQHPRWKKFATKLEEAIQQVKKVNATSKKSQWAKQFELLHTRDGIPIPRIRSVLVWYCIELPNQDKYLPVAYSGAAFRQKFFKIEDAMDRMLVPPPAPPRDEASEGPTKVDTQPLLDHFRKMAKIDPDNYKDIENDLTENDLQVMAGTFNRTGEMKITRR